MSRRRWMPIAVMFLLMPFRCDRAFAASRPSPNVHFYFVQITDTHMSDEISFQQLRNVVASINQLPIPIACVVHTGDIMFDDITNENVVRRSLTAFARLRPPVHFVAGNHDIIRVNLTPTLKAYRQSFGPLASRAVTACRPARLAMAAPAMRPPASRNTPAGLQPSRNGTPAPTSDCSSVRLTCSGVGLRSPKTCRDNGVEAAAAPGQ